MSTTVETLFRNDELASFLTAINERFTVTPLAAWDGGPAIVLRHDVDLDLRPAHRLAALERRCGVRSTFFVLTTCPLYNVLAAPAFQTCSSPLEIVIVTGEGSHEDIT